MKTIDNLKAPKTGVERYEEMDIRWLFSNLVNQPLKALLAQYQRNRRRRGFIGHVPSLVILVPSRTLVS